MEKLFNVKMRASKANNNREEHISGAERVVSKGYIYTTVSNLINRALQHDKGEAEFINISINNIDVKTITYIPCLNISTIKSQSSEEGKKHIVDILNNINIETKKAKEIIFILENIENMRGAILLDIKTMKRLEEDKERGIRVTGIDWKEDIKLKLESVLEVNGLNNEHVKEALVLASKVIYPIGIVGEICISDDPNYTTGYITIKGKGYFRITNLKQKGSKKGGRIFLFDSSAQDVKEVINFLEKSVAIVNSIPIIKSS